jgi:hypothetical protein
MTKAVTGRKRQSKEVRPRGVVRRMGDESEGRYPMSLASDQAPRPDRAIDWPALMSELGPRFAARADNYDATDAFVAENFAELKARDVFAAGVPSELGGGGASYSQLCDMLRTLAHYCGSTALTLSMHTHAVATIVWRWRRDPKPLQDFLRRIVHDRLVLVVSGASDWLNSSGVAQRVAGGWRVNGKKIFASGSPFGDLLMTQAVDQAPRRRRSCCIFRFPFAMATWRFRTHGTFSGCVERDRTTWPSRMLLSRNRQFRCGDLKASGLRRFISSHAPSPFP